MHVDVATLLRSLPGALVLIAASTLVSQAQEHDRSKVPDEFKWDLTAIYPSDQAWRAAKEKLISEVPKLRQFQGTLASSASRLADALETENYFDKEFSRLYVYASMNSDQDTRVSTYQGMQQEMIQFGSMLGTETAFIEPEILKMDNATVERFLAQEPRLNVFRHYLEDTARRRAHTLSNAEEKLLAGSSVMASAPSSVYGIFADADFPYPSVTQSDGKTVKLDKAAFSLHRASPSREERQKVMDAFFTALGKYRGTFGSMMNSNVQASVFYAHARHYDTSLQAALDRPNIPISVYSRLVDGVDRNLPTFYRYLKLRKRMMELSELHYYDLYAPLVSSVNLKYPVDVAEHNILVALAPLGPEYAAGAKRAFTERWIDMYPTEGKTSGAYSNGGAFDVHPYMLLNYNGKYDDMSTLAHDSGTPCTVTSPIKPSRIPYLPTRLSSLKSLPLSTRLCSSITCSSRSRMMRPVSLYWGTIWKASREPCSGKLSSQNLNYVCMKWLKKASPSPATPCRNSTARSSRNITGTIKACASWMITLPTSGPTFPISTLCLPVRHLLHRFLCSVGESALRRSGGHAALSEIYFGGQVEIPGRTAERRRRRHDDRRTA